MSCLFAFPEELIETVLSYCVVSSSTSRSPTYHGPQSNSHIRSRVAILLACKSFYRIGAPLFYHTISIQSSRQLRHLLAAAIRPNLRLATYIRQIIMSGIWAEAGELFYHCRHNLKFLDLTLDSILNTQGHEPNTEEFCKGLYELKRLSHIVVRKPNNVYLTRPKLQYVLSEMARAMYNWDDLEYVDLSFRLSDDSGGTAAILSILPIPVPIHRPRSAKLPGPVTQLTQVLSTRPKLHTFSTHLPNVWNENILRVSQNPALERIILIDGAGDARDGAVSDQYACGSGIAGTGHFFAQAKRHVRLSEQIRAGTSITRGRAQTVGISGYPFGYQTHCPSSCGAPSRFEDKNSHVREIGSSSSARSSRQISDPWEYYSPSLTPGATVLQSPPVSLSTSAP